MEPYSLAKPLILFVVVILCSLSSAAAKSNQCVSYGECYNGQNKTTCVYNGPPKPVTDETALDNLKSLCPTLELDSENSTCCSSAQIISLYSNMMMMGGFFQRCPSCYQNLASIFCHLTCSPDQSDFLQVTASKSTGVQEAVLAVSYYITNSNVDRMFESCMNVRMAIGDNKVVYFFCNKPCDSHKFMVSMVGGGRSPIDINFIFEDDSEITVNGTEFHPMNATVYPCGVAPKPGSAPCSCVDCPCKPIPYPEPKPRTLILGLPVIDVVMIIVYIIIFFAVVGGFILMHFLRKKTPPEDRNDLVTKDEKTYNEILAGSSWMERLGLKFEMKLQSVFCSLGTFCASFPLLVLLCGMFFIVFACFGLYYFEIQTNPVDLWSAPTSRAREEKDYFDEHFGPFYRTEQIIITRVNGTPVYGENLTFSNVFDRDFLHKILDIQTEIKNLVAEKDNKTIRLTDICYAPIEEKECMIESVTGWFQNDHSHIDRYSDINEYLQFLQNCTMNPMYVPSDDSMSCIADFGGPVFPYVALGGVQGENYANATALILTFMVKNHRNLDGNDYAMAWEEKFLEYMKNLSDPEIKFVYSSERSIQDELNRESISDVKTVVISYLIMFLYVSIALGKYDNLNKLFVQSKMTLGLGGVLIVLLSVASSLGIFSYFGVPSTLIVIEVIPFLVLAVGVDNIFIIVQAYSREPRNESESRAEHIGRVFGKIAPSLLLASMSECCCFFLGGLSDMPAVRTFALYSAVALLIDFLLQITCFLALLSLDAQREESLRMECCCCIKVGSGPPRIQARVQAYNKGFLYKVFEKYYAPFLMGDTVRVFVLIVFSGWFCSSMAVLNQIDVGLDQKLSMPGDSYVLKYFKGLEEYLSVGPPVYFVVKSGFKYEKFQDQNTLCGITYCNRDSLPSQIDNAVAFSDQTYIAQGPLNWLDNYFQWINEDVHCCRVYKHNRTQFCPSSEPKDLCGACNAKDLHFRPKSKVFKKFLVDFLSENPNKNCTQGGHAGFADAIEKIGEYDNWTIGATHFMGYHSILKTSHDYTMALKMAREISDNITTTFREHDISNSNAEVFPYSIFYVYYEQYLTILKDTIVSLVISMAEIFVVTFLFMGLDAYSAAMMVITIVMIIINLMGLMYWWNISLNAVALVNIVMSVGISVEFCSHIIRSFATTSTGTRVERARYSLANLGSSVLSGITLTKFAGIIVLGFSKSEIFRVFYFRMYLGIVIIGACHGLIFLPVMLSVIGPPGRKLYQLRNVQSQISVDSNIVD